MTGFVRASSLYDPATGERFPHPAEQVDRGDRVIADGGLDHECPVCGARYYSQGAAEACCGFRNVLVTDGGRSSGNDRPREESPWYCPECQIWVGWRLDECSRGHDRPHFPLRYDDVEFDYSLKVTLRHRLRGKLRSLRTRICRRGSQ